MTETAPGIIGNQPVFLPGTGYLYSEPGPAAGRTDVPFPLWFTVPDAGHTYRIAGTVLRDTSWAGWTIGTKSPELWDDTGSPVRVLAGTRSAGFPAFLSRDHKAVVYNRSHVTEYLNGVIISQYAASGRPPGAGRGGMTTGSWQPFGMNYAGKTDDFRTYDRAPGKRGCCAVPAGDGGAITGTAGISGC